MVKNCESQNLICIHSRAITLNIAKNFLGGLQTIPFQKIIVGKTPRGGGDPKVQWPMVYPVNLIHGYSFNQNGAAILYWALAEGQHCLSEYLWAICPWRASLSSQKTVSSAHFSRHIHPMVTVVEASIKGNPKYHSHFLNRRVVFYMGSTRPSTTTFSSPLASLLHNWKGVATIFHTFILKYQRLKNALSPMPVSEISSSACIHLVAHTSVAHSSA